MDSKRPSYADVLGVAYDVSSEPDRFDDLLVVAHDYFFSDNERGELRAAVPRHARHNETLDRRMARLSNILEEELNGTNASTTDTFHARLSINSVSFSVDGNAAAERLTGCSFPCRIDDLPFDYATLRRLRGHLLPSGADDGTRDRIVLAIVEKPDLRSCLALIQRPKGAGSNLTVAISYIDWSAELLAQLADAFGLTSSELEVLEASLQRYSQKQIAALRGTSVDTVKDHAKAILRKTGCSRMSDVAQLSASIAYLLRQYPEPANTRALSDWQTPTAEMHRLAVSGGRELAYYKYGFGKRHILFIHGFLFGPFLPAALLRWADEKDVTLICPSRPGFGYTSPSQSHRDYNQTVINDCVSLASHVDLQAASIFAHQGGVSHAFRIAAALTDRVENMVMINAGIPIDETTHLAHMNRITRMSGIACKHAPSLMATVLNLGMPVYRKRGVEWGLRDYFKNSPVDLRSLDVPETLTLNAHGSYHIIEQGADAWVRDGAAAMADWKADFDAVSLPQTWIHAEHCPIMAVHFVEAFIRRELDQTVQIIAEAGANVLYDRPYEVLAAIDPHFANL